MDNKNNKFNDMEYTVVLDKNYKAPVVEAGKKEAAAAKEPKVQLSESQMAAEKLYEKYEKMFLRDFTALDKDDIYPHSYQWRVGDRYSEDKLTVVEAAIKQGKRIADTEEYLAYIEKVKKTKFSPGSWE